MKIESSQLGSYEDAPWLKENIEYENEDYVVYKDGYPVTEGHLLFVPKIEINDQILQIVLHMHTIGE